MLEMSNVDGDVTVTLTGTVLVCTLYLISQCGILCVPQGSNPYRASPLVRGSNLHSSVLDPLTAQLHSPKSLGSPQLSSPLGLSNSSSEIQRLSEDLMAAKTKLASWEESWAQAKQACDAWKKEAEESAKKAKEAEQDKLEAIMKKDQVNR